MNRKPKKKKIFQLLLNGEDYDSKEEIRRITNKLKDLESCSYEKPIITTVSYHKHFQILRSLIRKLREVL